MMPESSLIPLGLRALHGWLANAAGILPLSAFIAFADASTNLHLYDLYGSLPLWTWAMTPAAARLLLASLADPAATFSGCYLDRAENSTLVHCIDGRWGDVYPSSSSHTVRLCVSACSRVAKMVTAQARRTLGSESGVRQGRPLTLEVIRVKRLPAAGEALPHKLSHWCFTQQHSNSQLISVFCWLAWATLVIISVMTQQYISVAYLATVVATGIAIQFADGHHAGPRRLLDSRDEAHPRLVVASNNMNAVRWTAFLGGHKLVDSLLNKPLYSTSPSSILDRQRGGAVLAFLPLLIAGQWGIIVAACAMQDWSGLLISTWIAICACCSAFYTPEDIVREWLRINGLCLEKAEVIMSNRRVMLSALVALNPDQSPSHLGNRTWIDPILAPSDDRTDWEQELYHVLQQGTSSGPAAEQKYWWEFIMEGLQVRDMVESVPWSMS